MAEHLEYSRPGEIEKRSFAIIQEELDRRGIALDPVLDPVIRRVIHTTADFDYVENLVFSEHAVEKMQESIQNGAWIVTDTNMARSGISKKTLEHFGGKCVCFMADEDVAKEARERQTTRAVVSMERAAALDHDVIVAVGNAPTALFRLCDLIEKEQFHPQGIIAVPVGFVNVVEGKEKILKTEVPHIVARGRKGGSNVAAAVVNALLYGISNR